MPGNPGVGICINVYYFSIFTYFYVTVQLSAMFVSSNNKRDAFSSTGF
jgi:hypothetical protein